MSERVCFPAPSAIPNLRALFWDRKGISALEYAVLAAIVIVAVAALATQLDGAFEKVFTTVIDAVPG
ncbi:hypothetical protein [Falsiroseomonas oryzae]|uniref:hypothetical protein n=1 Tax=Falsiroseomonas oryzae TaxID=2766473 RepID=UPI0022EA4C58|nr:hypothetical protein [Roseomonas sp. MO-31]